MGARTLKTCFKAHYTLRQARLTLESTMLGSSLEHVASVDLSKAVEKFGASAWSVHRVDLHNELLRLATSEDMTNLKPVKLRLGAQVVDASTDGSIFLADGSCHTADLIVAADGLHSILRDTVLKRGIMPPSPSGLSAFRFLLDTKLLKDNAKLMQITETKDPGYKIIIDAEEKLLERHMVWYPCRGCVSHFSVAVLSLWAELSYQWRSPKLCGCPSDTTTCGPRRRRKRR